MTSLEIAKALVSAPGLTVAEVREGDTFAATWAKSDEELALTESRPVMILNPREGVTKLHMPQGPPGHYFGWVCSDDEVRCFRISDPTKFKEKADG